MKKGNFLVFLILLALASCGPSPEEQAAWTTTASTTTAAAWTQTPSATSTPTPTFIPTATPIPLQTMSVENIGGIALVGTIARSQTYSPHLAGGLVVSHNGLYLACSSGSVLDIYNLLDDSRLPVSDNIQRDAVDLAFSPDGGTLALGYFDMELSLAGIMNFIDYEYSEVSIPHDSAVVGTSVSFSPDGSLLALSGLRQASLWQMPEGSLVDIYEFDIGASIIAFSPDGTILAVGSHRGAGLLQAADGTLLHQVNENLRFADALAFSPDGTLLAIAGRGNNETFVVEIYLVSNGTLVKELLGHNERITTVAFSPDGSLLATGSADGTVRFWQTSDWSSLGIIEIGEDVDNIAFTPDGTMLFVDSYIDDPELLADQRTVVPGHRSLWVYGVP